VVDPVRARDKLVAAICLSISARRPWGPRLGRV